MKILIRNLLLTITFFINFCEISSGTQPKTRDFLANFGKSNEHENHQELNSAGIYGAGSSGPSSYSNNPHRNIPPMIIHYKERDIEVSFLMQNGHFTPANCKVLGPHLGVPTNKNKEHINFITRALMYGGIRYCVVYETGNGEVLGAKLPPILDSQLYTGDPRDFNPDTSKCYITYGGLDFVVNANPDTRNPSNIKLLPRNISPDQTYIYKFLVKTIPVHFGGLYFLLYQRTLLYDKPDTKIVGADLDPHWRNRLQQVQSG